MSKKSIIKKMEQMDYYYDDLDSHNHWVIFYHSFGRITFDSWKEVERWIKEILS